MISTWVIVMLVAFVNGARNEDDMQPCAQIQTSGSVVPLGSPVTAICVISEDCPLLVGQPVHIKWRLGDQFLPSSPGVNESSRMSRVVIPSFSRTQASLTCCVQGSPDQVVGGVVIRAGYAPAQPQNLSCQTNLTTPNTLTCRWDPPKQETHLPTNYTLHTKLWDLNENHSYELQQGVHHYVIPRSDFSLFSDMNVYVTAVNELGEATSEDITIEPVSAAKFDPPMVLNIQAVTRKYGCLKLRWRLSQHQDWMQDDRLNLEVRLKTADSSKWSETPIQFRRVRSTTPLDLCRLLNGTQYGAQVRVRYKQSPWSEWSPSSSGVTLETAPTGRLDSWLKVLEDNTQDKLSIHMFWKPSTQFRANGQNVSYTVSVQRPQGERGQVCSTKGNYCYFQISSRAKKVYLSAVNAAGKSRPNIVRIYLQKAVSVISDVSTVPRDDRSLLIKWKSLASPSLTGFVVEWTPLLNTDPSFTKFEISDRNQTSLVISGSFEPDKPYGISVYPRFKDGIGLPQTVNAYSRQRAPSMVPKFQHSNTWWSHIELTWDEIPLNKRNGIIKSYKVYYWKTHYPGRHINVVNANPEERKVILKDLDTESLYDAVLMVSTFGGSANGTTFTFQAKSLDLASLLIIIIPSVFGLVVFIFCTVLTCFSNSKRLKGRFWPAVPDPANSSIKRWTSESSQESYLASDNEEPNPVYLSHLSFLDVPAILSKQDQCESWLNRSENTSDLGESICGSPFIPGYSGSNSDSVAYATVVFSDPCSSPSSPTGPPAYLRSESTQPLLETEESFTPKCYQNIASDGMKTEQCFFGPGHDFGAKEGADLKNLWEDFPFLRALAMSNTYDD